MKTFRERLDEAWLQGELANAMAHLMVRGDVRFFTERLLQGNIELKDELLYQHIEHVMKKNPGSFW